MALRNQPAPNIQQQGQQQILLLSNMTCVYNYSEEIQRYLASLQAKSTPYFIPALIMMSLSIPVGIVGNSLVCIVYSTKLARTALRTLIICMSVFDLLVSIYVVPGEIYDLLHVWDFNNSLVCKVRRYFNCTLIVGSSLVLVAIAITRYKMVCCPPEKRVTITQANVLSVILPIVSLTISLPYFFMNGSQKRPTPDPNICGYFCQIDDQYTQTIWPTINSLLFIGTYLSCAVAMIVSYVCIGHKVWTHKIAWNKNKRLHKDKQDIGFGEPVSENTSSALESNRVMCQPDPEISSPPDPSSQDGQSAPDIAEVQYRGKTRDKNKLRMSYKIAKSRAISSHQKTKAKQENSVASDYSNERQSKRNYSKYFQKRHNGQTNDFSWTILTTLSTAQPKQTAIQKEESFLADSLSKRRSVFSKTSWMMATISVVYLVAFVPLLALNLYKTLDPKSHANLEGVPLALFHLFFRSYLLNSAIIPILFSVWDTKFRRECIKMFNCCRKN